MNALIYDHVRTPRGRGRADGSLRDVTAISLAVHVLQALRDRHELDTGLLDDVVLGCAQPVGEQGGNIARAAVITAEYAETVAGQQVHRFCASALEAINNVAAQIMSGQADAGIGGGVESMSRVCLGADSGAWVADPAVSSRNHYVPQGIGADLIATLDGYSRRDVDLYALESQTRASAARAHGYFKHSVIPVRSTAGNVLLEQDETPRPNTTLDLLSALKPAFAVLGRQFGYDTIACRRYPEVENIDHVHTGGNSSGIADGAAAVLLGNERFGNAMGIKPRARVRGFASIGSEPTIMLTAPAGVTTKVLKRCGMTVTDVDLFEINEAFSSVVLRYMRALDIDPVKVNVNGGAIALGHPLGATGAMILGTVLDELERRDLNTALVTLCAGNGLGTATIIERV